MTEKAEDKNPDIVIGPYYNALYDELIYLGNERDAAEKEDMQQRRNRRRYFTFSDTVTSLCTGSFLYFSMSGRGESGFGQMALIGSVMVGVATYVSGGFKKMAQAHRPTPGYERARLLDLVIYDKTICEPAHFGKGGLYKYPETPQKWDYMQQHGLAIRP